MQRGKTEAMNKSPDQRNLHLRQRLPIPPQYLVSKDDLHVLTLNMLDHSLENNSPLSQGL